MRHDRIEVPSITSGLQRRRRRAAARRTKFAHAQLSGDSVRPLDVIDEAFADFTRVGPGSSRIDVPSQTAAIGVDAHRERVIDGDFIATLSAQLKALDQQRDELSRLLQTVDVPA